MSYIYYWCLPSNKRKLEKSWNFCKKGIRYILWFSFILGLNYFISLCFKLVIYIHYHTQKQTEIKFKPSIKLNHNIYYRNICYFLDVSGLYIFTTYSLIPFFAFVSGNKL